MWFVFIPLLLDEVSSDSRVALEAKTNRRAHVEAGAAAAADSTPGHLTCFWDFFYCPGAMIPGCKQTPRQRGGKRKISVFSHLCAFFGTLNMHFTIKLIIQGVE